MRAFVETAFDICYLLGVISLGIVMVKKANHNKQFTLFGLMAIVLGLGDAFHLVPRAYALCTTGLQNFLVPLGVGKLITSITMTIFYILLYYVWRIRYQVQGKYYLTYAVFALSILRIGLCLSPQNHWTSEFSPMSWEIYRNIPFALLGLIIIYCFALYAKKDSNFKYMWLTIVLSFGFYLPVVLFARYNSAVGMLMIPKTLAYVWTVLIGYNAMKTELH